MSGPASQTTGLVVIPLEAPVNVLLHEAIRQLGSTYLEEPTESFLDDLILGGEPALGHERTQLLPELIGQLHLERRHGITLAPVSDRNKTRSRIPPILALGKRRLNGGSGKPPLGPGQRTLLSARRSKVKILPQQGSRSQPPPCRNSWPFLGLRGIDGSHGGERFGRGAAQRPRGAGGTRGPRSGRGPLRAPPPPTEGVGRELVPLPPR